MILRECIVCDTKYKDYDDDREAVCKNCYRTNQISKMKSELTLLRAVAEAAENIGCDLNVACEMLGNGKLNIALSAWREVKGK